MKGLGETKLTRRPRRILISVAIYILVLSLSLGAGFGVCYAYFSAKVEASGTVAMGKLTVDYYNESGSSLASNLIVYSERDSSQNLLAENGTVMPGDILHIKGQIKNPNVDNAIDCYTLIRVQATKTYSSSGTDVSYKDISYYTLNGTQVVAEASGRYNTAPTLLEVGDSVSLDLKYELLGKEVDNSYSKKDVELVLTLMAYQTSMIEENTYSHSGANVSIYGSVGLQATHTLIGHEIDVWGDNNTASTSLTGSGTEASPYLISSINDLLYFKNSCMGASSSGKHYKMTKHLDLNNKSWSAMSGFCGVFDGDGYSILNLNITTGSSNYAFFGDVNGATIKNLTIKNVKIDVDYSGTSEINVAPLVAYSQNNDSCILNCGVIGSSAVSTHIDVNCTSSSRVSVGGLIATHKQSSSNVVIENCYSMVNISTTGSSANFIVGGICSRSTQSSSSAIKTVKNCYFIGSISTTSTNTSNSFGLIVGYADTNSLKLENCFAISTSNYTLIANNNMLNSNVNNAYINSASQTTFTRVGEIKTAHSLLRDGIKDIANLRDEMGWSLSDWDVDSGINLGYPRLRIEK